MALDYYFKGKTILPPSFYTTHSISDLKSKLRELKLNIINSEYEFKKDNININKQNDLLKFFINNFKENDIITGSLALSIFGLIDRDVKDIDIIIDNKTRYSNYSKDDSNLENRLGIIEFKYKKRWFSRSKKFNVDFFENTGCSSIDISIDGNIIKVQNPIDIASYKLKMLTSSYDFSDFYRKNYHDLLSIFDKCL